MPSAAPSEWIIMMTTDTIDIKGRPPREIRSAAEKRDFASIEIGIVDSDANEIFQIGIH